MARAQFAARGYEPTTVRGIAREADVDPALVIHLFGSKEDLFEFAMRWPFDVEAAVLEVTRGPRSQMGRRFVALFLSIWDDPATREPIMGMLRAATTSETAADLLRRALRELLGPIGKALDVPDAQLRMTLCGSHFVGLALARYIVRLEPLASTPSDEIVRLAAPAFQRYLTGKL